MRLRRALILASPLLALLIAWTITVQPFSGPDEPPHYLRALSISEGKLVGPKVPPRWLAYNLRFLTPASRAWVSHDMREVSVPAAMAPALMTCMRGGVDAHGCVETSGTGDYYPLPYLLPAAALAVSHDAVAGLRLARVLAALSCWALLVLSVALLWSGTFTSLLGLLVAITPMDLYVMSVLNPSGVEIAATTALTAGVLRITRNPARVPGWVWVAVATAAVVTILSWQMGPAYVACDGLLAVVLLGARRAKRLYTANALALGRLALALAIAVVLWLLYGALVGVVHSQLQISLSSLHYGWSQMSEVLHDTVYGPAAQTLPKFVYWLWWLVVAGLGALALAVSGARDRAVLIAVAVAAMAFPIVFFAWSYRFSGFPLAARYALPILMMIPMLAGELIHRARARLGVALRSGVCVAAIGVVAGIDLAAWWEDGRWSSGSAHWFRFFEFTTYQPWLGWWPWIALAVLGSAGMVTLGAFGAFRRGSPHDDALELGVPADARPATSGQTLDSLR